MIETRKHAIEQQLREHFDPVELLVKDQSHLHAGHEGARDGRGHFDVTIVAETFRGKSRLQRHRLVHDALKELLQTDIHALRVKALAPGEN